MDAAQFCTAWTTAIADFNTGDLGALEQLLAPGCVFEHVGTSRDEIIAVLRRDRAAGWTRHDILSLHTAGTVMTTIARNTFADGSTYHVGGVLRFDADGKIVHMAASDERVPAPA